VNRLRFVCHRLFFGKKQVVAAGFGRDRENEYKEDLHKISDRLHGNRALLFTDRPKDEVIKLVYKSHHCSFQ